MRLFTRWIAVLAFIILVFPGCLRDGEIMPVHDEKLIYQLPFDLVYLRTIEAMEKTNDWEMEITEKEKGTIQVRNTAFSQLSDADQRVVTVIVSRISRNETSVQLAPDSQKVIGGDRLLEQISQYLSQEVQ